LIKIEIKSEFPTINKIINEEIQKRILGDFYNKNIQLPVIDDRINIQYLKTFSYNYLKNKKDVIEYLGLCLGDVKELIENNNINIDHLLEE
jgi:hypothetical protein